MGRILVRPAAREHPLRGRRVAVIGMVNRVLAARAGITPRAITLPLAARLMRV